MNKLMTKCWGFTLVELIVFIVCLAVLGSTILLPLATVLRNTPKAFDALAAMELAKGRMELILAQFRVNGFTTFTDICSSGSATVCATSGNTNYTISSTIGAAPAPNNSLSQYKQIIVTVAGNNAVGGGYAQLTTLVANYGLFNTVGDGGDPPGGDYSSDGDDGGHDGGDDGH